MPTFDCLLLCDHVRSEGGVFHAIAAGIDHIRASSVPFVQNFGVIARIGLVEDEWDEPQRVDLIFKAPSGEKVLHVQAQAQLENPHPVAPGLPVYATLTPNVPVPIQSEGVHTLELHVGERRMKTLSFLVYVPSEAPLEA